MQTHYPQVQIKEQNGKPLLQIEKVYSVAEAIKWLSKIEN
jgi:hypothetical protein